MLNIDKNIDRLWYTIVMRPYWFEMNWTPRQKEILNDITSILFEEGGIVLE